ncbi:hypothetical protein CVCC1112_2299 [Paenarthrobacter nicotinovorans]|nr:hypothetical protein CVCC1112_2299 [Paenarthrobacter nicotinovorans]
MNQLFTAGVDGLFVPRRLSDVASLAHTEKLTLPDQSGDCA